MAICSYQIDGGWKCSQDALPEKEHCYWHNEVDSKKPTEKQLDELKEKGILGIYLQEANLQKANLGYANLQKAFLWYANLQEAKLRDANLQKANLCTANLQKADLTGANLQEAFLESANLQEAKLGGAKLQKARLGYANLQEAKLGGANLQEANLWTANLQEAFLWYANLQEANLTGANLQEANLGSANLQEANLWTANLQEAFLGGANLQEAFLESANLQEANLTRAKLQEANLTGANLQGANLHGARFDSKTILDNSEMIGANLFRSYFDMSKSFRNVKVFHNESKDKEINEIAGGAFGDRFIQFLNRFKEYQAKLISKLVFFDSINSFIKKLHNFLSLYLPLKPYIILNFDVLRLDQSVADTRKAKELIRYVEEGNRIIFFDIISGCVIKNPENGWRHKESLVEVKGLRDLVLKDGKIQQGLLYDGDSASLYEASYEVYNNLYNFYIANGRLDKSAHVHYRREDVHRKLRWEKGGWKRLRSIFDLLILRSLTGYGDRIDRPIIFSVLIIGLFAALFKLTDGIVKNVNGEPVTTDWIDYIYHSITTFTSLGYSNIQPNLAVGHIPQILVAVESGLGVMMMALIIFVITYQISR